MKRILYISCFVVALSACNSSPKQTQTVITPTPTGLPSATTPVASTGERPTNNPAHGQPFHDCALPVGAPLTAKNNTPATAAPTTPVAVPVTASPASTPVTTSAPAVPKNKKGVKLNPAHGQPGHSCAIAVGAPLT